MRVESGDVDMGGNGETKTGKHLWDGEKGRPRWTKLQMDAVVTAERRKLKECKRLNRKQIKSWRATPLLALKTPDPPTIGISRKPISKNDAEPYIPLAPTSWSSVLATQCSSPSEQERTNTGFAS
nr:hypothetical protein Iba_chr05cCG8990 [Ipomoea batatas]